MNVFKVCNDKFVQNYVKTLKNTKVLYECSQCTVFGTEYRSGVYVLLPESTNNLPVFGKICKVLCSEDSCHLYYKETKNTYLSEVDLFIIKEKKTFGIVQTDHLADYHVLNGYKVGESQQISISLRNFHLEHI